jgi:quinol monooxygenase YgiN
VNVDSGWHGPTLERHRPEEIAMWAQLIRVRLKPGSDLSALADVLRAAEQPESGLLREFVMQDQHDVDSAYVLAVFESEEKAREREQDPRRAAGQQAIQELMAEVLAGPPEFSDLVVTADWAP